MASAQEIRFFRTYRAKLLITVDNFALKSKLTGAYIRAFQMIGTVMQEIMAVMIATVRVSSLFSNKFSTRFVR
ncbi:hypothetical protein NIES4071_16320 [Calothrix sp. NIES-4071]|nr:hypothetical protein NIES4071_16320 [Calothrix sp. NIES-4071]BAZ55966.1 hypothetical protein NIES4105_16270 [Calothrix sp. NIES-4105]